MTTGGSTEPAADKPNWWHRGVHSGTGQAIRWLLVLGLVLWRWAAGLPSDFTGWVPVLILSLLFLLPDADSVAFAGVKLEMRRTREEVGQTREQVEGLRQQVTQLQVAQAQARAGAVGALNLTTDSPAVAKEIAAAVGLAAQVAVSEESEIEPYDPGTP